MTTGKSDVVFDAYTVNYNCINLSLFLNMRSMCYEAGAFQRQLSTVSGDRQKQTPLKWHIACKHII